MHVIVQQGMVLETIINLGQRLITERKSLKLIRNDLICSVGKDLADKTDPC